jgi:hypothetical protein
MLFYIYLIIYIIGKSAFIIKSFYLLKDRIPLSGSTLFSSPPYHFSLYIVTGIMYTV